MSAIILTNCANIFVLNSTGLNKDRQSHVYVTKVVILTDNYRFLLSVGSFMVFGHAVAQLVEALPYKSEGRGFDSRCQWNFH